MVYTISTFQLPTGTCMSLERRKKLLEVAERRNLVVLEDHVYGDLRFEGEPVPTLFSLDTAGRVMIADSFSKTVTPGLRLGWLAGHPDAIAAAAATRQDLGVSLWLSRVMSQFIAEGKLDDHIRPRQRGLSPEARQGHRRPRRVLRPVGHVPGPAGRFLPLAGARPAGQRRQGA